METMAVCGICCANDSDQPIEPSGGKENGDNTTSHTSRFRTWRLPQWINFSYAVGPRFKRPLESRPPIPFRNRQRSFSRLDSINESNREEQLDDTPRQSSGTSGSTSLVQKHPPHPTWDDEPRHDIPYDNPYYSRPIASALWLPRNPCGVLDLDDTIDLHQSLTSEPGAGDFGSNQSSSPSGTPVTPIYESPARSPDVERGSILLVPPKQCSGEEEIDLPEGIRNRVLAMDGREEIESTDGRRPSLFHQRNSSHSRSGKSSIQGIPRRHHTMEDQAVPTTPISELREGLSRPRAMSYSQTHQQTSRFPDPALRPDSHAQAELIRATAFTVPQVSRTSVAENVTTGEAVLNEAIAEEKMAAEQRLKQEEADAAQPRRRLVPAWLASWFYARVITR